jgi:hypothetical protein
VNHRQLVAELRRLFEEERRVQWSIGDLLVREYGSPIGDDHANTGALDQIETLAQELGVALATLLKYRRMAATFPDDTRISSATWTAHEAASASADPPRVIAEAAKSARESGMKVTPTLVREVAARYPKETSRQSPRSFVERRQIAGGWGTDFISTLDQLGSASRRLVDMLAGLGEARDEQLTDDALRVLLRSVDLCESRLSWVRAYVRGDHVADEAAEFLKERG